MILANHLSRFPPHKDTMPIELHQNILHIHFLSDRLNIIYGPSKQTTFTATYTEKLHEITHIAYHFWGTRDELTIVDGILLKGDRVCILPELYKRTLTDLHGSHKGIEEM